MKIVLSSISFSFLLIFIAGCTVVQSPAPTQTAEVKKENNREPREKKRDRGSRVKNNVVEQKTNKTQPVPTTTPKTTNNRVVDQKSNQTQTVPATIPTPVASTYRLKVTLTDIQCLYGRDGDSDPDDYGLQQYVVYKALGKEKNFLRRDINKFRERINHGGQVPNIKNMLINGDMKNQIHVQVNNEMDRRDRNMINNSLVFRVTSKELEDPNASFKIFTWLKEYSYTNYVIKKVNDDKVLMNNTQVNVKIKDVIEILSGVKSLNENTSFPAEDVGRLFKFHNFGAGYMHLANIQKIEPMVLEGPIHFVSPETIVAVWIQFQLID
ncbi:MAG: hypothetical protein ABI290_10430 [Ginsengibacter sp.]